MAFKVILLVLLIAPDAIHAAPNMKPRKIRGCGVTYKGPQGSFKSPMYPSHYPDNLKCPMVFKAKKGHHVVLTFEDFDVEFETNCIYDNVIIYNGPNKSYPKIGTYCGTTKPGPFKSKGRSLSLYFESDFSVQGRGFKGMYKEVKHSDGGSEDKPKCGKTVYDELSRIVGGSDTIIEKHPWQVYLEIYGTYGTYTCGAAIIAKNWLITAAHCFEDVAHKSGIGIYAGSSTTTKIVQFYTVKKLIEHTDFDVQLYVNDIALIEINDEFDLTNDNTRAVCLAEESDSTTFDGKSCTVTGWGDTAEGGHTSEILQEVSVIVTNRSECLRVGNDDLVVDTHLCAGHLPGGKDSCAGDSGGPLVCKRPDGTHVLAGIVSFGYGCARKNTYGYYTRVSHYAKWISENMKE